MQCHPREKAGLLQQQTDDDNGDAGSRSVLNDGLHGWDVKTERITANAAPAAQCVRGVGRYPSLTAPPLISIGWIGSPVTSGKFRPKLPLANTLLILRGVRETQKSNLER